MDDGLFGALQGFNSPFNQVLTAGRQDLKPYIVGNRAWSLDQAPCEVKVGLGSGGEGDLDFLVTDVGKHLEVGPLLVASHRINQTLVAISEIGRKPSWRFGDRLVGPLAVWKMYRRERPVLLRGVLEHGHFGQRVRGSKLQTPAKKKNVLPHQKLCDGGGVPFLNRQMTE